MIPHTTTRAKDLQVGDRILSADRKSITATVRTVDNERGVITVRYEAPSGMVKEGVWFDTDILPVHDAVRGSTRQRFCIEIDWATIPEGDDEASTEAGVAAWVEQMLSGVGEIHSINVTEVLREG